MPAILAVVIIINVLIWGFRVVISAEPRKRSSSNVDINPKKKKKATSELMIENFIETLVGIRSKAVGVQKIDGSYSVKILENGKVEFSAPNMLYAKLTISKFPSLEILSKNDPPRSVLRNPNRRIRHILDRNVYCLSAKEFDQYCETRFNAAFELRISEIIELCKKEELQQKLQYLIPRFEISFTTILNVINEQLKVKSVDQLPETMVEKMFYIIESFEKELFEAEENRCALESLETKALEKSLEEQLEFEVKYIDKVKAR